MQKVLTSSGASMRASQPEYLRGGFDAARVGRLGALNGNNGVGLNTPIGLIGVTASADFSQKLVLQSASEGAAKNRCCSSHAPKCLLAFRGKPERSVSIVSRVRFEVGVFNLGAKMKKLTGLAIAAAFLLSGCGGGDNNDPVPARLYTVDYVITGCESGSPASTVCVVPLQPAVVQYAKQGGSTETHTLQVPTTITVPGMFAGEYVFVSAQNPSQSDGSWIKVEILVNKAPYVENLVTGKVGLAKACGHVADKPC